MKDQEIVTTLQLTSQNLYNLMGLLDIARKAGSRQEAALALNYMDAIEANLKAQQEVVEPEKVDVEQKPKKTKKTKTKKKVK